MDKYSIFILGNNNNTNVEFVEKPYKLNAGETLVGKDNDFPEKKSLGGILDVEPFFSGWKVETGSFDITEDGRSPSFQINLATIINNLFPAVSGESFPDRYITGELELLLATNHWYRDERNEENIIRYQVSVTANRLYRFSWLKNYATTTWNSLYNSISPTLSLIHQSGRYTTYVTTNGVHHTVQSVNFLPSAAISASVVGGSSQTTGIVVETDLKNVDGLPSTPNYITNVHWKLRMFNHEVVDYTEEVIKP